MKHHAFSFAVTALFLLLFTDAHRAHAQQDLPQLAASALTHSHALRASGLRHDAHRAAVRGAYGRLLPEVRVDVMYTHMNDALVLDLDPIRAAMISLESGNAVSHANIASLLEAGRPLTDAERAAVSSRASATLESAIPHFTETLKEQTFLQGAVSLRQPLFAGGKILAGIRAAQAVARAGDAAHAAEKDAVIAETAERYLDLLLARENLAVRQSALATITRHVERADALLAQGLIARPDRQRAEVALAEARRNLFAAEQKLGIARSSLASVTGIEETALRIDDRLRYHAQELQLDALLARTRERNHTLRQLAGKNDALDQKAGARFADYFPTVYGFGMVNLFEHYMIEKAEPHWAVGIGARFTLFDGLRRSREYEEARLEAAALREQRLEVERKISLLLRKEWMELQLAERQYLALDADLLDAEENLLLYERRFGEGLSTSLDFIDAQLRRDAIALERAAALHAMYSRLLTVTAVSGDCALFLTLWQRG